MKILSDAQGSKEWIASRLARPTCSQLHRIITKTGKLSTAAGTYIAELVTEWIIEAPHDPLAFRSQHMERGNALELAAIGDYEWKYGTEVTRCGLCIRDDDLLAGSPDGLVGEDGGVEIKTPGIVTHVDYLLNGFEDYYVQVQGLLFVTGRKWWDLYSFNPTLGEVRKRYTPDPEFQEQIEDALIRFHERFAEAKKKLAGFKAQKSAEIREAVAVAADDHKF